jgi:hypothetical protein
MSFRCLLAFFSHWLWAVALFVAPDCLDVESVDG